MGRGGALTTRGLTHVRVDLAGMFPVLLKEGFVFGACGTTRDEKRRGDQEEEQGDGFHGAQGKGKLLVVSAVCKRIFSIKGL